MSDLKTPRYPVYVPSKGRFESGLTVKFLLKDRVPFYLVVEPQEYDEYGTRYGYEHILVLPWRGDDEVRREYTQRLGIENGGLIAVRNWIREHATAAGFERHWQLDDNIRQVRRMYRGKRIPCHSGVALRAVEDFTDRYDNIGLSGLNYVMFVFPSKGQKGQGFPPFYLNNHVYSATLFNNRLPYKWRITYNDDTDMCLQVLAGGWCTVLVNAFLIEKKQTMQIKGGNTEIYLGDGRLHMSRSLERMWPGVVKTIRRFNRPQHYVADDWRKFDTPLKLKEGIDLSQMARIDEYGMDLIQVEPQADPVMQRMVATWQEEHPDE